ncbi:MAG: hypothetical protein KBB51_01700 [Candidatus Moranbacteria bacterium]|nr:hypothetical protein [Candidatus Moranbacteria bacterium]
MNYSRTEWIFRANILLFTFLIPILFGLPLSDDSRFLRIGISTILLATIFILPAVNTTAIFSRIFRFTFDTVEFLAVSITFALLFVPLTLCIEADVLNILSRELPLMNALASFAALALLYGKNGLLHQNTIPPTAADTSYPFRNALLASLLIIIGTTIGIVTAYYPLPDLDPYYWVTVFQDQFAKGIISSLSSYRPLFSSLTYLFTQSAGVDLYAFFKYLIPFFTLAPLIPAILIARRFSGFVPQLIIFLIPLVNASFFLYTTLPIPQSIFNSLLIIAIFFTLHALLSGKKLYFHLTGSILLFGFFFHEMAAIPFVAWLTALVTTERNTLFRFAKRNRLATGLVFAIILSNFSLLSPIFAFTTDWTARVVALITQSHANLLFPAQYTNIDGNNVGWQGFFGVMQYYIYYFGPASVLIVLFLPFIFRSTIIRSCFKKQEFIFLLLSLTLFFLISDILPRFFNIALLPERALGFVSLFLLAFTPFLLIALRDQATTSRYRFIPHVLLIALFINLGGALYINSLKTYLITPAQIRSAEWIRANLPQKHTVFSNDHHRLLTFYANANVVEIEDSLFYSDTYIPEKYLFGQAPKEASHSNVIRMQLSDISDSLPDLANKQTPFEKDFLISVQNESDRLEKTINSIKEEIARTDTSDTTPAKQYIYFAAPSDKNPYAHRPYTKTPERITGPFIFDQFPERFNLIYSDQENDIYLWEIL